MKKISSILLLSRLIERYSKKGTLTNNYLLLDSYIQFANDNRLFYVEEDSNLYFLVDKKDFYQLYYYINNLHAYFSLNTDKAVTLEIVYRGRFVKPEQIFLFWESSGFKRHIVRDNMTASYKQLTLPAEKIPNVKIKFADSEREIHFTKKIITYTFDKYTGNLLSEKEIDNFVRNKNILCAYWKEDLGGVLQFEIKNNIVWLGHIAISPEFRGKGIAKELVKAYIVSNIKTPNTRYQLWVMQNNTNAISLYEKFGFVYGNKSSASMLKL